MARVESFLRYTFGVLAVAVMADDSRGDENGPDYLGSSSATRLEIAAPSRVRPNAKLSQHQQSSAAEFDEARQAPGVAPAPREVDRAVSANMVNVQIDERDPYYYLKKRLLLSDRIPFTRRIITSSTAFEYSNPADDLSVEATPQPGFATHLPDPRGAPSFPITSPHAKAPFQKLGNERRFAEELNELAWNWAIDPDTSDWTAGSAYRAARRACELTNWKNGQYIDTFAAVLAAQGDMAGAVEFQQLALDHAPPTEKYDYEMRLYAYRSHLENRTESPFVSMRAKYRNIDLPAVRR